MIKKNDVLKSKIIELSDKQERNICMMDNLDAENWSLDQEIGELLKKARRASKKGLRETARKLKISAPYLQDMENGRRHFSEEYVKQLLKII